MKKSNSKNSEPLIVQQKKTDESVSQPLPYQIGAETYDVFNNTKNPFNERSLAAETPSLEMDPLQTQSLFRHLREAKQYQLSFPNENSPYRKRNITAPSQQGKSKPGEYIIPKKLREDAQKLKPFIEEFFKLILQRLQEDPYALPVVINELIPLFQNNQVQIKIYDAFKSFTNWQQFLETLEKIAQDQEIENFEFFCSALFGFYSQLR